MTERDDPPTDVGSDDRAQNTVQWRDGEEVRFSPSRSVVEAVAEVTDRDPKRLRPLYEVIDPDGLDALFECNDRRYREAVDGHVAFGYEGCDVCVSADGRTVVSRSTEDAG